MHVKAWRLSRPRSILSYATAATIAAAVLFLALIAAQPAAAQGVTPDMTTIPASQKIPTMDGNCSAPGEYSDAVVREYADAFETTQQIYLKHAEGNLYVCVTGAPGTLKTRFFRVYADPENGNEAYAGPNDLAFQVEVTTGALSAYRGTGVANGWTAVTVLGWEAVVTYSPNYESAEFRIPLNLVNDACGKPSGLAVYHHWVRWAGDDYGWPNVKWFDRPETWEDVLYGGASCVTELGINKKDSADPAPAGQQFLYILTLRNNGNSTATNFTVTDPLPATLVYDGYNAPAGVTCTLVAGTVTCAITTLSPGGLAVIELKVRGIVPGDISNTAAVNPTALDPILANNTSTERTTIGPPAGRIAYVFRSDTVAANQFKMLLESNGFTVALIPLPAVLTTDFALFDLVIVAHDTGYLDEWPSSIGGASLEATHIAAANRPVVGLGEGGYAYFGKGGQALGWPHGWHGPLAAVVPVNTGQTYWHVPFELGMPPPSPLPLYGNPVAEVGIHLPDVSAVLPFGMEPTDREHAPLLAEENDCDQLWGFSGPPEQMTGEGRRLFVNAVTYGLTVAGRCVPPKTPPAQCLTITKTATPLAGTAVPVGGTIKYEIKYTVANLPECALLRAVLTDKVPEDTLFIPSSASDGIAPGADRVLRWNLGPLAPGATGSKTFKVEVGDAACRNQKTIVNQARLVTSLGTVFSNVVTHQVDCPPVIPDGTQPPYAEDEIQIYPYPLITGQLTEMSVRVRNLSADPQSVVVTFEMSGAQFGIGLPYGPLPVPGNPRTVLLPPHGTVEVKIHWIPVTSGHYCVRVKIEIPGANYPPIYTQRNLDVAEDLRPGVQDDLLFAVGNPTATIADIRLVVINTCPGWDVWVAPTELLNMAPGELRHAILSVIPPVDRPLGTECHIDVQGWIGDKLIGGIRKLDVPPVHLPRANPSWMEREIVVIPDPPVLGVPGQICVDLQNPLPGLRLVNIEFSVANFGAGIGFVPVGSLPGVVLPSNSLTRHCINWLPTEPTIANLHRCILVRINQPGFIDQFSQRNVDLRRLRVRSLDELLALRIPFSLGNPAPYPQKLRVEVRILGLRGLRPIIDPDPPMVLPGGTERGFILMFEPVPTGENAATVLEQYGDATQAEVAVFLDDQPAGGFTVVIELPELAQRRYLPLIRR